MLAREVRRAKILTQLWHQHDHAPRSHVSELIRCIEHGRLLDDYGALLSETPVVKTLAPFTHKEAIALGRGPIIAQARKMMARYVALGGDRAAIPEHLRFLISQSA